MGEDAKYREPAAGNGLHNGYRGLGERGEHERGAAHVHEEPADPELVQRIRLDHLELEGEGREDVGALLLEDLADVVAGGARQRQRHRLPHLAPRRRRSDPTPPCAVRLPSEGWLPCILLDFFGGVEEVQIGRAHV